MASSPVANWMFVPLTPPTKQKLGVETCALVAVVCGIVFGAVGLSHHLRGYGWLAHPHALQFKGCDNPTCRSYSAMLARSLSKTDSPCWNFYRFVCKGYANTSGSVLADHMRHFADRVIRTLVTVVVPASGQSPFEKAAKYYQSCIGAPTQQGNGQFLEFRRIMRDAGVMWPSMSERPDFLFSLAQMNAALNVRSFLNIATSAGDIDNITTVNLTRTSLLAFLRARRVQAGAAYFNYYAAFRAFFVLYDDNVTEPVEYAEFLQTENYVFLRLIHVRHVLRDQYASLGALLNLTPSIPPHRWSEAFRRVRTDPPDRAFRIRLIDVAFLRAVSDLLSEIGEGRLHFYVGWMVAQQLAPFMSQNLAIQFHGSLEEANHYRPMFCLSLTERVMGLAVYSRYETEVFDEQTREMVDEIINHLFISMMQSITNDSLTDHRNKTVDVFQFDDLIKDDVNRMKDEASLTSLFSGFDDMTSSFAENWRKSERARRNMSPKSRLKVASAIISTLNSPGSYHSLAESNTKLQPYSTMLPLFDHRVARSVNYAALGSFIAVGMFRFFSESLSLDTNLHRGTKHRNVSRCYSRLGPNPTRTLAYQRAVSLTFLWKAFGVKSAKSTTAGLRRGPARAVSDYTNEELFYLAFCYPFCMGRPSLAVEHSCNEPLRHSQHFPRVFGCHNSSNMNPRFKCGVGY
ncbi:hypothetical protein HPB47_002178 [Ixodes persulcatus]|uniref:Uncharacterized protein n=1 Tax=Ixodes persulcatus TaxID=34615 RepID=A0AC60PM80_IXOPE|nr:hypothetical protein HPB47_002178 [Ixodes persulcatus]